MKSILLLITLTAFMVVGLTDFSLAQKGNERFKPFVGKQEILDATGPGISNANGDILLVLREKDDDDVRTLMLLHNKDGKLHKIAENSNLLMGDAMLGNSGGGSASLDGNNIVVTWGVGSNSGYSVVSIEFEKFSNGNYEFGKYRGNNYNYSAENLFTRTGIDRAQTGPIAFAVADEEMIIKKAGLKFDDEIRNIPVDLGGKTVSAQLIPNNWEIDIAVYGDLNLDEWKKDLLLVTHDYDSAQIRLLMQQKDGSYKLAQMNTFLLKPEGNSPFIPNIKGVIKNGFFTIERRVPTTLDNFDHRYITFKFDAKSGNWFLHRYDVEHYLGYSLKPEKEVIHLTKDNFGTIAFSQLDYTPGDYRYEPVEAVITGVLNQKMVYGPPSYGKNPDKDQKKNILILKPDYPVNVYPYVTADMLFSWTAEDGEIEDPLVKQLELQTYSADKKTNAELSQLLNKKVKLKGTLSRAQTGGQHTPIIFQVERILP